MRNNIYRIVFVLIIIVIIVTIGVLLNLQEPKSDYELVRIHIRANSNSTQDQALKHQVKNRLIEFITPLMQGATNKEEALKILGSQTVEIQAECNEVLKKNNIIYQSSVYITQEEFPTRRYGELVFEQGIYDALIINLGEAVGDNWWCVAFPPLCFVPEKETNIKYKSKILEIISKNR